MPSLRLAVQLCLLSSCSLVLGEPVPVHGSLGPAFDELLTKKPFTTLDAFLVPSEQVVAPMRESWEITRSAAQQLQQAKKPSELSSAWGALVPTCANCHAGDPAESVSGASHGAAMRGLLEGVRVAAQPMRIEAAVSLRKSPDLGPSHERILQLADRIASEDRDLQSAAFVSLVQECWRCHESQGSPAALRNRR